MAPYGTASLAPQEQPPIFAESYGRSSAPSYFECRWYAPRASEAILGTPNQPAEDRHLSQGVCGDSMNEQVWRLP